MLEHFYKVEQVSEMLDMHPKTIQRYIREGKLRASKIGKGWRISGHDLSLFTEENKNVATERSVWANNQEWNRSSSVIDINVSSRDEADRITNSLVAAMNIKPPEYGRASMSAQYLDEDCTLRIMLWGSIRFLSAILQSIEQLIEQNKEFGNE